MLTRAVGGEGDKEFGVVRGASLHWVAGRPLQEGDMEQDRKWVMRQQVAPEEECSRRALAPVGGVMASSGAGKRVCAIGAD